MTTDYAAFIDGKRRAVPPGGFEPKRLPKALKPFQRAAAGWAIRMGRAALFLDTGLGKTLMQLAWADAVVRHTARPAVVLSPLAVGPQTVREAAKFGVRDVALAESAADVAGPGVYVTNYQKLHRFDPAAFAGVVLDESSILKSHDGRTRSQLIDAFRATPYRLACTATPAPNDHEEVGNHAEFLGVMTRAEMLATFFVHDSGDTSTWRLKGHAEGEFWRWVASWAMVARTPADLGHPDPGYDLPPLRVSEHRVGGAAQPGRLFAVPEAGLAGQRKARRDTLEDRCRAAAELAGKADGPVVVWCELNAEADLCERLIPGAVQVAGKDDDDVKAARLDGFTTGAFRVLVSKPSLAGFGLNWQHCRAQIFVGLSHSFEAFYQAVRRSWRYGQTGEVDVSVVTTDQDCGVFDNVRAKAADHAAMFEGVLAHTREVNRAALAGGGTAQAAYREDRAEGRNWTLLLGDNVRTLKGLADASVGYSVFSPPFASLYVYSDSPHDMGNVRDDAEFFAHFSFLLPELYRVLMPGRLVSFHCMNLPTTKERDGFIGVRDFRGLLVKAFEAVGFIFHSEVCVWKDPVTAMQRTKALGLLHKQVKKDSCMSRQGIPDYVVTMRKPGANPEPVAGRFEEYVGVDGPPPAAVTGRGPGPHTRDAEAEAERYSIEVWQRYASPVWMDVDQTNVLAYAGARDERDERHVCPLQLDVIARCLDLWSNPGDLVLSPFAGIGSEGYQAVKMGRRFVGCELKPSYFAQAVKHLARAEREAAAPTLFDGLEPGRANAPEAAA